MSSRQDTVVQNEHNISIVDSLLAPFKAGKVVNNCDDAEIWVKNYGSKVPINFEILSSMPSSYYVILLDKASGEVKSSVWRARFAVYLNSDILNQDQEEKLWKIYRLIDSKWFDLGSELSLEEQKRIVKIFGPRLSHALFGSLDIDPGEVNSKVPVNNEFGYAALESDMGGDGQVAGCCNLLYSNDLGLSCGWGLTNDRCVSTPPRCGTRLEGGCGFLFAQECNGKCGTLSVGRGGGRCNTQNPLDLFDPGNQQCGTGGNPSCTNYAVYVDGEYVKSCYACDYDQLMECALEV